MIPGWYKGNKKVIFSSKSRRRGFTIVASAPFIFYIHISYDVVQHSCKKTVIIKKDHDRNTK